MIEKLSFGGDGRMKNVLMIIVIEHQMETKYSVVTDQSQLEQPTKNISVEEQIKSCNKWVENLINRNIKLEKRMKEMETNFVILCMALIFSLGSAMIILYM